MNKNTIQEIAARTIISSELWQSAKFKRDKVRERGFSTKVLDTAAHTISGVARGIEVEDEAFKAALETLFLEVAHVGDTLEGLLAPAKK